MNMNYNFEADNRGQFFKKILKEVIVWVVEILIVIGLAYALVTFGIEKTTVVGDSMQPCLQEGDQLIINKFIYHISKPKRNDVIVFEKNGKEHSYYNLKRIIGLPGETVQIIDGEVYINDKKLEENINVDRMQNEGFAEEPIKLEAKEYFVLGDNRNNSEDSRFANIGNVIKDDIVGKAWVRTNSFNFVSKINIK